MENISYFCIVKHLEKEFRTFLIIILMMCAAGSISVKAHPMDSVEVSLLTCSPHEEVYSLYGHSALRWHEYGRNNVDVVFNWGLFSFDKPYFVLRFVFGLTDYELGAVPFSYFREEYSSYGSSVTEQILDLAPEEKTALKKMLTENIRPENSVYRYNFFYDNCSTRPRNIIEQCLNGKLEYAQRKDYTPSFRDMVHQCVRNHPWAAFGNDMLLGVKADLKTNMREQEFLPENLLYDFDRAQIVANNGTRRPLVKERRMAVPPGVQIIKKDFPLTPMECACLLLAISALIFIIELRKKTCYVWWDVLLMIVQGLAGIVLTVMLFSQHPATSSNLQILLLNPIPLFFIPSVIRKKKTRYWNILLGMIVLFLIGAVWQHYAEGMLILALCLLTRFWIHHAK